MSLATAKGFFAELQRQQRLAEQRRAQAERAAARAHAAAVREAARAARESERARLAAHRASAAEQKQAEKEAKERHLTHMLATVEAKNQELAEVYEQLDSILAATLEVDDFVDLERFRVRAELPPFPRPDLETPLPLPPPIQVPAEPVYVEPVDESSGLGAILGGRKRHEEQVEAARRAYWEAHAQWQAAAAQVPTLQYQQMALHQAAEQRRVAALEVARQQYAAECAQREAEAAAANAQLDDFICRLDLGERVAVEEYVWIVLSNTVYPEAFPVEPVFEYDADLADLYLTVWVPPPGAMPTVQEYRYNRTADEIVAKELPARDQKARYADVVAQTALRTLHEVFEADRRGLIQTVTVMVATETIDTATGRPTQIGLVAVAADRERVLSFDLRNVVPADTLAHLNAVVSKNPFGLVGIDVSKGVRG